MDGGDGGFHYRRAAFTVTPTSRRERTIRFQYMKCLRREFARDVRLTVVCRVTDGFTAELIELGSDPEEAAADT